MKEETRVNQRRRFHAKGKKVIKEIERRIKRERGKLRFENFKKMMKEKKGEKVSRRRRKAKPK